MTQDREQPGWVKKSRLGTRGLVAITLGPLVLGSAYFGGLFFLAVAGIIVLASTLEYYALARRKGARPHPAVGLPGALLILAGFYLNSVPVALAALVFITVTAAIWEVFRGPENSVFNLASTVFGPAYIAGLFGHLVLVRQFPLMRNVPYDYAGRWIVALFLTVWICDTAAFFVGSSVGKHRLAPRVSPNKTWEGAVAGLVAALLSAYLFDLLFLRGLTAVDVAVFGAIVGVFGQISDLTESLIKRDAGVKDSSRLIPGHGGMLDRFDSLILIAPALYWYLRLVAFP